jgi:signal transduction histidine kinase
LKLLSIMLLLCFISFLVFGIYSVVEVKSIYKQLTHQDIKRTTENTLAQRLAYLEKEATLIQKDMENVEQNLLLLKEQTEYIYSLDQNTILTPPNLNLVKHPKGYYWEPINKQEDTANIFISSRANFRENTLYKDLQRAQFLEPLLKQTVKNDSTLKAVFFTLSESAWIIYPGIDAPFEVSNNKLPHDILVQEHEFYYMADPSHNPEKTIQWTNKYKDVTQWGWVITAVAPVYLSDGTFRGVIGADFPIKRIATRIENLSFKETNAFAFILDQNGVLLAGNEDRFNKQFKNKSPLKNSNAAKSSNGIIQVWKDSNSESHYILAAEIPNTKWVLSFSIPENDIVQPIIQQADKQFSIQIKKFINRLLLFLIFTSGLLVVLTYNFSVKMTKPINHLTSTIRKHAAGTYGYQIQVQAKDEIGQLTTTFNEMSLTIHGLIKELQNRADVLEERVSERTKELAQSNEHLLQTLDQLKESEQARAELILHLSHDLKTPLTKVKGFLQVIKGFDLDLIKQKEYIDLILLQTNQIVELINDLTELSSLHFKELPFEKEWYPADFLIDQSIEMVYKEATKQNIHIFTDYVDNLPLIYVDPKRMSRVLTNILSNAIKYSKIGRDITIHCRSFTENGRCILSFEDNGIGINEDNLKRIFDIFYRENRTESDIYGSGIGMSIVKNIVEGHDGFIDVKSKVNVGTTVTISLPIEN